MKKILYKIFLPGIFAIYISFSSCNDFLEKPPGVDITEDTIFSSQKNIETFLFGTYRYGLHSYYPYNKQGSEINPNPTQCMTAPITDEAEMGNSWYSSQIWNTGSVQKSTIVSQEDTRWSLRWQAIRRCNILLERLPEAPVPQSTADQFMGEVYFIRALNNFEMMKRYGGMPIVDKRLSLEDELHIPRSSFKEFVDYILEDCENSARLLNGVQYENNQRGRITQLAALALKSKVLLYVASPLFNTSTPYLNGSNNELICYGNYDVDRWQLAANAAKAVLDEAAGYNVSIVNTGAPEDDYRKMWEEYDNSEIILAEKAYDKLGNWNYPWCVMLPVGLKLNGWDGICVPHNFIRKYEKMNGQPQTWNEPGISGNDLMQKYAELDPRFRQTVGYNGSVWNNENPELQLYTGGENDTEKNITGAFLHKLIPYALNSSSNYQMAPNGILFRLGEAYLNYAEALNEMNTTPPDAAYEAVNIIRRRAGMPDFPRGLTQEQFRDRIKNERDIELAFEDHRLWDIRRWMDAEKEGVMQGNFYKVTITRRSGSGLTMECDYVISPYEIRVFHRRMYLHPILDSEVNKGYLIQNPGW